MTKNFLWVLVAVSFVILIGVSLKDQGYQTAKAADKPAAKNVLDALPKCTAQNIHERVSPEGSVYTSCNDAGFLDIFRGKGRHGLLLRIIVDSNETYDTLNKISLLEQAAARGATPCSNGSLDLAVPKEDPNGIIRLYVCGEPLMSYNYEGPYIVRGSAEAADLQHEYDALVSGKKD